MRGRLFLKFGFAVLACLGLGLILTAPPRDMRGVWRTQGYGLVVEISALKIDIYEISDISCIHTMRLPASLPLLKFLDGVTFSQSSGQLNVNIVGPLSPIQANRINTLPQICDPQTPPADGTAQENFDVAWQMMAEHYAFFDLHGIDWNAKRDALRPNENEDLTEDELFTRLSNMLSGLDDGHTYLEAEEKTFRPAPLPPWWEDRYDIRQTTFDAIPGGLTELEGTGLSYGWLSNDIGYLMIADMGAEASLFTNKTDVASANMQNVAQTFEDAKSIVIDIRYNGGGSDSVAMAYAGYFVQTALPVFRKRTKTQAGYTDWFESSLQPSKLHLSQPTYILTSEYTASAAEIFLLAMRALPQVTVVGTQTSGALSDVMEVTLPNGWLLGLSHQEYVTIDDEQFEKVGIPPDMYKDADLAGFVDGQDTLLEYVQGLAADH